MSTSEKKERSRYSYVCIYECRKHLLNSTYERAFAAREMTIRQMQDIVEIFNSEVKEICSTNQDVQNYIGSCHS